MTTSRNRILLLPLAFLVIGLFVFYPAFNLPSLRQLFEPTPTASSPKSTAKVWTNRRSGLYYCPNSKFYGKLTPGVYMTQSEAIQNGYQPAASQTCR